jgi:hypothetical protein
MLLSLLITQFLTALLTTPNDRELSVVVKAALIFITSLVLTTTAANTLFPAQSDDTQQTQSHTRNFLHKKRKVSPTAEECVPDWRVNTAPTLHWSSSSDEASEKKRAKKRRSEEKNERREEKSLRKRLSLMFKPKRHEMLGARKETVEEVVREDDLV